MERIVFSGDGQRRWNSIAAEHSMVDNPITKAIYYELTLPDGAKRTGQTDASGIFKLSALTQKGDCTLVLPDIDDAAKKKR